MTDSIFLQVWRNERVRKTMLSHMDDASLCALRLTTSECCLLTTGPLFARIRLTFTPSALSKPSRLEALSRIGHHVQHLTFVMPHTDSTFLPPLLNPMTGREVTFLYTPHTSLASESHRPKYGTQELGDILTQQYPPIFHAATNVPAFIRTMAYMSNMRHLTVSCPGQDPAQRYRRDAVDYALISLRIAIERAHLVRLVKLSLDIHASGLLYFRHIHGFGSSPAAGRRWKQIRKLKLSLGSWDFESTDHLKLVDDYIRGFSAQLEKVSFTWNGHRGPCPFALAVDPLFTPRRKKLFAEVTSPMSPLPAAPPRPAMKFPKLRYMQVRNVSMAAEQVADLVCEHRHTVRDFEFDNVTLTYGTWEEALEPLNRMSGSDSWHQSGSESIESFKSCQSHVDHEDPDVAEAAVLTTRLKKRRVRRRRRRHIRDDPPPAASQSGFFDRFMHRSDPAPAPLKISAPIEILPDDAFGQHTLYTYNPPPPPPIPTSPDSPITMPHPSLIPRPLSPHPISIPTIKIPMTPRQQSPQTTTHKPRSQPPQPTVEAEAEVDAEPLILQPTTYHSPTFSPSPKSTLAPVTTPAPQPVPFPLDPTIRGVQRNLTQESAHQELADDADKRVSALRKAREVVLMRLGSQFCNPKRKDGYVGVGMGVGVSVGGLLRGKASRGILKGNGSGVAKGLVETGIGMGHSTRGLGVRKGEQLVPLMIFR